EGDVVGAGNRRGAGVFAYATSAERRRMPRQTRASSQSVVPRCCSPSLAVSVSAVSGPCASVVNRPSSTALSNALDAQKARPSSRIASGTGCLFVTAVLLIRSARDAGRLLGPVLVAQRARVGSASDRGIRRFSRRRCRLVVIVLQRAGGYPPLRPRWVAVVGGAALICAAG